MKRHQTWRVAVSAVLAIVAMLSVAQPAQAYVLLGYHIPSRVTFVPYSGFGSTTISHFNEAIYQWNSQAGWDLMSREPVLRHYSTNYPYEDGNNYIYKVNTGSEYVAECTSWYYEDSNELSESDININAYYAWANSAQPGAFDVWSVFLHETGHTAGLDDNPAFEAAVMYPYSSENTLKRFLHSDDRAGINALYR